jgi:predicted DNA-binding transcriptional regulator AlpA
MSIKHLRPRQAAEMIGIGLSTFWHLAKNDPDFPQLVRLSTACTIVRESDLEDYIAKKAGARRPAVATRQAAEMAVAA